MNHSILDNSNECSSVSGMSTYPWGLDLSTPGITIRHSSFPGMNIDLDGNNITTICAGTFNGITYICSLHLCNNNITEIPIQVESFLSNVRDLDIDLSKLKIIGGYDYDDDY